MAGFSSSFVISLLILHGFFTATGYQLFIDKPCVTYSIDLDLSRRIPAIVNIIPTNKDSWGIDFDIAYDDTIASIQLKYFEKNLNISGSYGTFGTLDAVSSFVFEEPPEVGKPLDLFVSFEDDDIILQILNFEHDPLIFRPYEFLKSITSTLQEIYHLVVMEKDNLVFKFNCLGGCGSKFSHLGFWTDMMAVNNSVDVALYPLQNFVSLMFILNISDRNSSSFGKITQTFHLDKYITKHQWNNLTIMATYKFLSVVFNGEEVWEFPQKGICLDIEGAEVFLKGAIWTDCEP